MVILSATPRLNAFRKCGNNLYFPALGYAVKYVESQLGERDLTGIPYFSPYAITFPESAIYTCPFTTVGGIHRVVVPRLGLV